jgi:hypothetical protein
VTREVERTIERVRPEWVTQMVGALGTPTDFSHEMSIRVTILECWQTTLENAADDRAWMRYAGVTA